MVDPTGVMDYRLSDVDSSAVMHLSGTAPEEWDLGEPVSDALLASLQAELAATDPDATLTRV